jgi:hypothetical protein
MDIFDEEIILFWKSLTAASVRFILVGGYATNLHGYQRYTGDMDIWIEDSKENRLRLRQAFKEYGMGDYPLLEDLQIVPGWTFFHLNNGMRLDVMTELKGLEQYSFNNSLTAAALADIEGVKVPVLHINQLILAKKASNRPKDQLDVLYLEKIKKLREEEGL